MVDTKSRDYLNLGQLSECWYSALPTLFFSTRPSPNINTSIFNLRFTHFCMDFNAIT